MYYYKQLDSSPFQSIHMEFFTGFCVALMLPSMTTQAVELAPNGLETTMVSLAYASYEGVGKFEFLEIIMKSNILLSYYFRWCFGELVKWIFMSFFWIVKAVWNL